MWLHVAVCDKIVNRPSLDGEVRVKLRRLYILWLHVAVCESLVSKGEKQDEESVSGRRRMDLLQTLALMNPTEALHIRTLCVRVTWDTLLSF